MKTVYTVTINNFIKHNSKLRKTHTHFLINKRIFNDPKICSLTPSEFRLYVYFLSICADFVSNSFRIDAGMMPNSFRISSKFMSNSLERMQSLQLLSYASNESLLLIESKVKETSRVLDVKEKKETKVKTLEQSSAQKFEDQFTYAEWVGFLKQNSLTNKTLSENISKLVSRFETLNSLQEFIAGVLESPSIKNSNKLQSRRYVMGALMREAGLK